MRVSDYIVSFLKSKGIGIVFELQGGMITNLIDAVAQEGSIRIVSMHHEQACAMAVDAVGRIGNIPSVAFATSGPGAVNLLTGVACSYFDSVPAIFITGQVNSKQITTNKLVRQTGFQETDIVSMAKPITKKAYAVRIAKDVPAIFEEAYEIAVSGRMGSVLIDIPIDLQNEEI